MIPQALMCCTTHRAARMEGAARCATAHRPMLAAGPPRTVMRGTISASTPISSSRSRKSPSSASSRAQTGSRAARLVVCASGQTQPQTGWIQAAKSLLERVISGLGLGGSEVQEKSSEYTDEMQARMGTSLTYRHEDGINYAFVLPDLIVGSCLQTPADVDRLADEAGVTTVFNLQEDCDMEYFGIDVAAIQARARERGVEHVRFPVRDFDPFDLRLKLPKAVSRLARAHNPRDGVVYIHCTAGLGRAPATALAYMFWLRGWSLPEALRALQDVRTCSPRIESIRAATADLLTDSRPLDVTIGLRRRGTARSVQVAGLDVGWHTRLDLSENPSTRRLEVKRTLLPGSYPFKFVLDDHWCASLDHPTYRDGNNTNNMLTVLPRNARDNAVRERLLSLTGDLLEEERLALSSALCPWSTHDHKLHVSQEVLDGP